MQPQRLTESAASTLRGLSQEEAAARRAKGLGNTMPVKSSRSYAQIVRENVFNPINDLLYVLGIALVALGRVSDALVSVGVVLLNVAVSVIQEVRAKRVLDQIALLTRPRTTVIRTGQEQSVDPGDIVKGDVLLVRPGDQIVVDGPVLSTERVDVDESLLTGESDLIEKRPGDQLYSGSFCVNGSAFYQAEKVGAQSVAYGLAAGARAFRRVYLEFLMVLSALTNTITFVEFVQRSVVIVGIVPIGLILAIAVAYTLGAVRIVRKGALVQQANAIESLSNVDMLCMDKTGTLTTNDLELIAVYPLQGKDEAELRRLLGDFVASGSVGNVTSKAIGASCPGQQRRVKEEIPFSSAHKWSGLAIDDEAMRGSYILGAVEMLQPALSAEEIEQLQPQVEEESEKGLRVLLFAYSPELVALRDDDDRPKLPDGLVALGLVILRDQLRPEARKTLQQFTEAGIHFKVISGDSPQTVAALAKQVGLSDSAGVISGLELAKMGPAEFAQVAEETTIFGRITPQQKEQLLQALRDRGHYVAMIGDGVNDVLSLKKANLGIAMQSGSQATRNVADIVLLKDSFASLPPAFREGQRIRNGMQDILMLFLTRVLAFAILIIEILVIGEFPFVPTQVSILTFLAVGAPALVLAAWAYPGIMEEKRKQQALWEFVLPASLMIGVMGLFVYIGEYLATVYEGVPIPLRQTIKQGIHSGGLNTSEIIARLSAQTALTTFTLLCGILLIVFVEPPSKFWVGSHALRKDKRIVILALVMFIAYVLLLAIPPLRNLFDLELLGFSDYLFIVLLVVLWIFAVRWAWRAHLLERFLS
ncbi:MAG: HAD family hydrolase [Chloroflexi bacterium]|nr:MAG: HAD family hydrolase [Chloroflexota bacterium]